MEEGADQLIAPWTTFWATFSYQAIRSGREGVMTGTIDIEGNPWRDHFGPVRCGRSGGRGEARRRPGGHWTRRRTKKGEGWGRRETRDSDVPSRRISPLTLLSYKWGCHLRWPQRQGEREGFFFF